MFSEFRRVFMIPEQHELDLGPSPCPSEPSLFFLSLGAPNPSLGKESVGGGPGPPSPKSSFISTALPSGAHAVRNPERDFSSTVTWPGLTPFWGGSEVLAYLYCPLPASCTQVPSQGCQSPAPATGGRSLEGLVDSRPGGTPRLLPNKASCRLGPVALSAHSKPSPPPRALWGHLQLNFSPDSAAP